VKGTASETAVVGETPNLAARLQALAQPNQIVPRATPHRHGIRRTPSGLLNDIFERDRLVEPAGDGLTPRKAIEALFRGRRLDIGLGYACLASRNRSFYGGDQTFVAFDLFGVHVTQTRPKLLVGLGVFFLQRPLLVACHLTGGAVRQHHRQWDAIVIDPNG
jgi:hypothetical protein